MSCNSNGTKFGFCAVKTGISRLSSQAGSVAAGISSTLDNATSQVGQRVAPVSNRVLKTVDRPTTIAANLLPALATAAVYTQVRTAATGPGQGRRPGAAIAVGLRSSHDIAARRKNLNRIKQGVGAAAIVGSVAASVAADVSAKDEGKRKLTQRRQRFLWGKQKVDVTFSKSGLTNLLNRRQTLVSGKQIVSSEGDMVRHGASTWHRGTSVVNLPAGKRTITHLQQLGLPATNHYFERTLSDEEVAGVVSGQSPAHKMSGYVGTIGRMEQLAPSWAQAKRAMILTRLHWPTGQKGPVGWEKQMPGKTVVMKPPPKTTKQRAQVAREKAR
jgi:hypothetical protein